MGRGLIYAGLTKITIDLQIYAFYKAIPNFYVYYCKFSFCILYFSLSLSVDCCSSFVSILIPFYNQ